MAEQASQNSESVRAGDLRDEAAKNLSPEALARLEAERAAAEQERKNAAAGTAADARLDMAKMPVAPESIKRDGQTEVQSDDRKEPFRVGDVLAYDADDVRDGKADNDARWVVVALPKGSEERFVQIRPAGVLHNKQDRLVNVNRLMVVEAAKPLGAGRIEDAADVLANAKGEAAQKKALAKLGQASSAVADSKEYRVAAAATLSENKPALDALKTLLKILNDLFAKMGLKECKPLTDLIERTDAKLASFEWGSEKPSDPKKLAEQTALLDKHEGQLKGWEKFLEGVKTPEELKAAQPQLENLTKQFEYKANKKKFQDLYDRKAEELKAPKKPEAAAPAFETLSNDQKVSKALASFSALKDGESLTSAAPYDADHKFFVFDPQSQVPGGQEFWFLGVRCVAALESDAAQRLEKVVRATGPKGEAGVKFNDGFVPFESADGKDLKTYLALVLARKPFEIPWKKALQVKPDAASSAPSTPAPVPPAGNAVTPDAPQPGKSKIAAPTRSHTVEPSEVRLVGRESLHVIETLDVSAVLASLPESPANREIAEEISCARQFLTVYQLWRAQAERTKDETLFHHAESRHKAVADAVDAVDKEMDGLMDALSNLDQRKPGDIRAILGKAFDHMGSAESNVSVIDAGDLSRVRAMVLGKNVYVNEKGEEVYPSYAVRWVSGKPVMNPGIRERWNPPFTTTAEVLQAMVARGGSGIPAGDARRVLVERMTSANGDFADIGKVFEGDAKREAAIDTIKNGNLKKIAGLVTPPLSEDAAKAIYDNYKTVAHREADVYQRQINKLREQSPNLSETEYGEKAEATKKVAIGLAVMDIFEQAACYDRAAALEQRNSMSADTEAFADFSGLATKKGWVRDAFVLSPDNVDTMLDVCGTVALSAVTMGVGAIAARGALLAGQWTARSIKAASMVDRLAKTGRIGKGVAWTARTAGTVGVEGVGFYEGMTLANNVLTQDVFSGGLGHNLLKDTADGREIGKTVAFCGALRAVGSVMGTFSQAAKMHGPALTTTEKAMAVPGRAANRVTAAVDSVATRAVKLDGFKLKLGDPVPNHLLSSAGVASVLAEAGVVVGTSLAIDFAWDKYDSAETGHSLTMSEYLQAIAFVLLMRKGNQFGEKIASIKFRKGADGKLKADLAAKDGSVQTAPVPAAAEAPLPKAPEPAAVSPNPEPAKGVGRADYARVDAAGLPRIEVRRPAEAPAAEAPKPAAVSPAPDVIKQVETKASRPLQEIAQEYRNALETGSLNGKALSAGDRALVEKRLAEIQKAMTPAESAADRAARKDAGRRSYAESAAQRAAQAAEPAAAPAETQMPRPSMGEAGQVAAGEPVGAVRAEKIPTPPLARVEKIEAFVERNGTKEVNGQFEKGVNDMLARAKPGEPVLLGTQNSGNHLVAIKNSNGAFTVIEASGRTVVATREGVTDLKVQGNSQGAGFEASYAGQRYYVNEAFPVKIPEMSAGAAKPVSVDANRGFAQDLLSGATTNMGVRFGTGSVGNHVDLIRLNGNTHLARVTATAADGSVTRMEQTVNGLRLEGNSLVGEGWRYDNAVDCTPLTSHIEQGPNVAL